MVTCSFSTLTFADFPLCLTFLCFLSYFLGLLSQENLKPLTLKSLPSGLFLGEPRVKTASCTEHSAWEICAFRDLQTSSHTTVQMISYPNINIFTQRNYLERKWLDWCLPLIWVHFTFINVTAPLESTITILKKSNLGSITVQAGPGCQGNRLSLLILRGMWLACFSRLQMLFCNRDKIRLNRYRFARRGWVM